MHLRRLAVVAVALVLAASAGDTAVGEDTVAVVEPPAPALSPLAAHRTERAGLRRAGGDAKTEQAVERALAWLALEQEPDGSWPSGSLSQHRTGVTALALLAFLGHGHGPDDTLYGTTVRRALDLILSRQTANGYIGETEPVSTPVRRRPPGTRSVGETPVLQRSRSGGAMYDHLASTEALLDALLLVGDDERLRDAAQRAVHYLLSAQNPYLGWRYQRRTGDNDTSVTGWTLHVLWLAEKCGLEGEFQNGWRGGHAWIDKMTEPEFGRVGYQRRGGEVQRYASDVRDVGQVLAGHPRSPEGASETIGPSMTALALSARLIAGQDPGGNDPVAKVMQRGAEILRAAPPRWDDGNDGVDMYFWYWGTRAARRHGGKLWKDWNRALRAVLLEHQETDAAEAGSWAPVGPWGLAGRTYSTALCCLSLESYYRYDSLFER